MAEIHLRSRSIMESVAGTGPGPGVELPCPFNSLGSEAEDVAAYEASLRFLSVPYERLDLSGRCGRTHVVVSGPTEAPPVVLLHCNWTTLTTWSLTLADISREYRVYAVDVMERPGSIADRPIRSRADVSGWLTATLEGLGIAIGHLVRMSYHGWLTLASQGDDCLDWYRSLPGVCFLISDSYCGERCQLGDPGGSPPSC